MATQTTNLKLIKPSYTDAADITIFSGNMDILDEEVNKRSKEGHKHQMSDIEGLSLKAKNVTIEDATGIFASDNVEGALSELFTNVSNGKSSIAQAITAKGVPASASDDFSTLANKISQIISELLNIPFPSFNVGIGSVSATFDTLDSTFKEFRIQGQAWQTSNIFNNLIGNTNYVFEAKYGGNRVSKLSLLTPKANQAKPIAPTASDIKIDSITVTAPSGCKILFNGSEFDSPHTFTNLNYGTIYEFYSFVPPTNTLNKSPNSDALRVQTLDVTRLFDGVNASLPLGSFSDFNHTAADYGQKTFSVGSTIKMELKNGTGTHGRFKVESRNFIPGLSEGHKKLIVNVSNAYRKSSVDAVKVKFGEYGTQVDISKVGKYEININSSTGYIIFDIEASQHISIEISDIYMI